MATFPGQTIEYQNISPSGRYSAAEAPQIPTGGLEAIAQGLQNLGQDFEKVQDQKDATELSTMRRLFDESSYAHINKYSQLGNPDERKKEAEAWNKEVEGIQSESARVNAEFQKYKDSKMPDIGQTFANHELAMQAKENKAARIINNQAFLEQGDMPKYLEGLHTDYATGAITKAEMDYSVKWSTVDSLMVQINRIASKEPESASKILGNLTSKYELDEKHRNEVGKLAGDIKSYKTTVANQLDDAVSGEMIAIDENKGLIQSEFDARVDNMKTAILKSGTDNVHKKKLLDGLDKWRTGEGDIDYNRLLALNQEMDAAQRSGIVDPTIKERIVQANTEGAFGGRNKGGSQKYSSLIRRFEHLKFDERLTAVADIVRNFEKENSDDPRLVFLFHEAKNKIVEKNPDADIRTIFQKISGLAASYETMREQQIQSMMKPTVVPAGMTRVVSPSGKRGFVKQEELEQAIREGYKKAE